MSETATNAATLGDNVSVQDPLFSPNKTHVLPVGTTESTFLAEHAPSLASKLLAAFPDDFESQFAQDPALKEFVSMHEQLNTNFDSNTKQIPKYDWETLSVVFEHIYKAYNDEVTEILKQLDALDIKRSIWQESAFRIDTERATKKFKKIESWISNEDLYLNKTKKDLSSSVQIIRNTLEKLNNSEQTP